MKKYFFCIGFLILIAQVCPANTERIGKVENAYPSFSPDGHRVLFQSNRTGNWEIFTMKLDGSDLKEITFHPADDVTPVWSKDGKQIVFATSRDGNEEIYTMDANGKNLKNISSDPASDSHPSWSADDKKIVFCSTRGDGENDDLYIVNADGTDLRRLTDNGLVWDTFPSWSPDGSKILFRRLLRLRTEEGTVINSEIFVMNSDGTSARNLSRHGHFDGWPAWSPDGKKIAFATNRDDVYQIYVMNSDGSDPVRAVDSYYTDVRPQWSPDGKKIIFNREYQGTSEILITDVKAVKQSQSLIREVTKAVDYEPFWSPDGREFVFISNRNGPFNLYIMDIQGKLVRRLTAHEGPDDTPAWSPDGRRIAFMSEIDGNPEIYLIDITGSNLRRLTADDSADLHPTWSPDGKELLFNSSRLSQNKANPERIDILSMSIESGKVTCLTEGGINTYASWSPNGKQIVYRRSTGEKTSQIVVFDPNSKKILQVTSGDSFDGWPAWSHDSKQIVFASDRSGEFQIYSINPDGSNIRRIIRRPGRFTNPRWSPKGDAVLFTGRDAEEGDLEIYRTELAGM